VLVLFFDIVLNREEPAMNSRRRTVILMGIAALVLLVPALIWSGKRATDTAATEAAVKLPEMSTVGPEMVPYVLTPLEREKLRLPAYSSTMPFDYLHDTRPTAVVGSKGPYPGMTRAELEKLAAWQARSYQEMAIGTPNALVREREPISTIEDVPRAPGIEGMTPAEKAKLEAYLKERR
jgi:hypothetical protein